MKIKNAVFVVFSAITLALGNAQAAEISRMPASIETETEREYIRLLNEQADRFFSDFSKSNPNIDPDYWTELKDRILHDLKFYTLDQVQGLKEQINRCGNGPALTALVSEVFIDFVVAPVFAAFGMPFMAGITAALPWGVVVGGVMAAWKMKQFKWSLSRDLGIPLHQLEAMRQELMGFDLRNRLTTIVYEDTKDLAVKYNVEVVIKAENSDRAYNRGLVDVQTLEDLVASKGSSGKKYLSQIYQYRKKTSHRLLYALMLDRFVRSDRELSKKMTLIARERMVSIASQHGHAEWIHQMLLKYDDLQKLVSNSQKRAADTKTQLTSLSTFKDGPYRDWKVRQSVTNFAEDLAVLGFEIQKAEYSYLFHLYEAGYRNISSKLEDPQTILRYALDNYTLLRERHKKLLNGINEIQLYIETNSIANASLTNFKQRNPSSARNLQCVRMFY